MCLSNVKCIFSSIDLDKYNEKQMSMFLIPLSDLGKRTKTFVKEILGPRQRQGCRSKGPLPLVRGRLGAHQSSLRMDSRNVMLAKMAESSGPHASFCTLPSMS